MIINRITSDEQLNDLLEGIQCCDIIIGSQQYWEEVENEIKRYRASRMKKMLKKGATAADIANIRGTGELWWDSLPTTYSTSQSVEPMMVAESRAVYGAKTQKQTVLA